MALAPLIAGCAGLGTRVSALPANAAAEGYRLVSRPAPLPRGRVTADCGPEALCAVLQYWGKPADVDEVTRRIYRPDLKGTLSTALAPLAREKGLAADLVAGSINRVRQAVEADVPPIIMVQARPGLFHFFVVVGFNDRTSTMVCEDYDGAKVLLRYDELEQAWAPAGHYYLELRVANADADARAGIDFEARGEHRRAIEFFRRALAKDPDHIDALLGLGNCLYATNDRVGAREAYEKALKLAPNDPKLNNNLADLYLALGVFREEAERMAEKAVEALGRRRQDLQKELATAKAPRHIEIKRDLAHLELDLAGAFGTLGQARAAGGRHELAIGAWKASLELIPLTEFDWRARRLLEIGRSYDELRMQYEARKHYTDALTIVRDVRLKEELEERVK